MSTAQTELAPAGGTPLFPVSGPAISPTAVAPAHAAIPTPTRTEWNAAGLSLVIHLLMLLVLAALLIPVQTTSVGTSLDGGIGTEEGDGELVDSVTIGTPDPGKGTDIEKTATTTLDAVPAVEGALKGSTGSGTGAGHFDAVASLGAGGGGGSGKGVGFFGTRARAETVVFIVDMSGSMNDGRRFDRAVDELIRSLNALVPTQRFFIYFYNGVTYPMLDQRNAKLLAATPGNRTKVVKWIKTLEPNGDTAPEEAIERSLKLKPQVIYFLTDGEIPVTTRDTAKKFNRDHKTVIHTIAFVTEEGADILRGIAKDNRGKYRFVR
jgi:von Willebrand factor type A domain